MKRKNSLLFVQVFLLSILIASPFLIKQVFFETKKMDSDLSEIVDMDFNSNENTNSNSNKESNENPSSSENKDSNSNTNSNTNSNSNISKPTNSNSNGSKEDPVFKPVGTFTKVDDSYFNDALFIGDSRTVGIKEYGKLKNATYFCDTGMSIYNIYSRKVSISGLGKVDLKKLLSSKKYGKIYIMLGINEIGYSLDKSTNKFREVVQYIRKAQPDAIVVIQANLHVTKEKSDKESIFSNKRIDNYNKKLSSIADNKNIFYLDANSIFDDGKGNLKASYTFDNVHLLAKYYVNWTNYLKNHAVVFEKTEELPKEDQQPEEIPKEEINQKEEKEEDKA